MALDPFSLLNTVTETQRRGVEELRPSVDLTSAGFRLTDISAEVMHGDSAPIASTGTNVTELPASPADPRYRYRIPPPACAKCGTDHHPNKSYNHPYDDGSPKETPVIQMNGTSNDPAVSPFPQAVQGGVGRRVAVYVGRGDSFVLKVEENPPDWDDLLSKKVSRESVMLVRAVVKALGVKFKDATGGELDDDELAEDRPQPAPSAGVGFTREGFEAACRELGIDPEKVRATGLTGDVGPGADGLADAAGDPEGDGAEDQG